MWSNSGLKNRTRHVDHLRSILLDSKHSLAPPKERNHDQVLLEKYFWPVVRNEAMVHDSYTCQKYWNAQPFPTQRLNNVTSNFVGAVVSKGQKVPRGCPIQCRPYNHQDWKFCWHNNFISIFLMYQILSKTVKDQ